MRIEIAIPTLNRHEKLLKCLGSIDEAKKQIPDYKLFTYVYFSSKLEYELIDQALKNYNWIFTRLIDNYNASEFWNNHFKEHQADITFLSNDDVLFSPQSLKNSIDSMNKYFPDLDGVIGLYQENIPLEEQCKCAFSAIGIKFMDRFPNRKVFNEQYKRFFLDQELYEYASKIGKHYFDMNSPLIHLHPSYSNYKADKTHSEVRKFLKEDQKIYNLRKEQKLLWGENFNLINI